MNIVLPGGNELDVYESQYTPEQIEASIGKGPIVKNGTWWVWSVADSAYQDTGVEATSIPSNPDILINSDFRQPVNRQGKVEYIGSGYAIDRWYSQQRNAKLTVMNNCIRLENTTANTYSAILQNIDNPNAYLGKQITISLLYELEDGVNVDIALKNQNGGDGFAYTHLESGSTEWMLASATGVVPLNSTKIHFDIIILNNNVAGASINLLAAKLELCDHQTLAHQDESGNWVLNDPPNYALQYLLTSLYSPTTGEWVGIQHSNPNLLDNWYFIGGGSQQGGGQFPVNQRGLLEYAGAVYGIDRWLINASGGKITVQPDGVLYTNTSPTNSFMQRFPRGLYPGEVLTLSFLVDLPEIQSDFALTGLVSSYVNIMIFKPRFTPTETGLQLFTGTLTVPQDGLFGVGLYTYGPNEVKLLAAKLEFGPIQTLAHESAGGWQLNDAAPDFATELMRCQRYFYRLTGGRFRMAAHTLNSLFFSIPIPPMRAKPAVVAAPDGSANKWIRSIDNRDLLSVEEAPLSADAYNAHIHSLLVYAYRKNHGIDDAQLSVLGYLDFSCDL